MAHDQPQHARRFSPTRIAMMLCTPIAVVFALAVATFYTEAAVELIAADDTAAAYTAPMTFKHSPDHPLRDGFGVAKQGWLGVATALAHAAALLIAIVLCFTKKAGTRRLGLLVLAATAALLFANAIYMGIVAGFELIWPYPTALLPCLVATPVFTGRRW